MFELELSIDEIKAIAAKKVTKYFIFTGNKKYINTLRFGNIKP